MSEFLVGVGIGILLVAWALGAIWVIDWGINALNGWLWRRRGGQGEPPTPEEMRHRHEERHASAQSYHRVVSAKDAWTQIFWPAHFLMLIPASAIYLFLSFLTHRRMLATVVAAIYYFGSQVMLWVSWRNPGFKQRLLRSVKQLINYD